MHLHLYAYQPLDPYQPGPCYRLRKAQDAPPERAVVILEFFGAVALRRGPARWCASSRACVAIMPAGRLSASKGIGAYEDGALRSGYCCAVYCTSDAYACVRVFKMWIGVCQVVLLATGVAKRVQMDAKLNELNTQLATQTERLSNAERHVNELSVR